MATPVLRPAVLDPIDVEFGGKPGGRLELGRGRLGVAVGVDAVQFFKRRAEG